MTNQTRDCLDPWKYIEVRPNGKVAPCCVRPSIQAGDGINIRAVRNSEAHRSLRSNLLVGDLDMFCSECHIRGLLPADKFREKILSIYPEGDGILRDSGLEQVRVGFTHDCNLRCVYCNINLTGYDNSKISEENFLASIASLEGFGAVKAFLINGHGEATFHPNWLPFCQRLLEMNFPVKLTSNFARRYTDEEISALARFHTIEISIDTSDEKLLKSIRRSADLRTIVTNMTKVRAAADKAGLTPPTFFFLCGLYDKNVLLLEDFAWFAVASNVTVAGFWNLIDPGMAPAESNPSPLRDMEPGRLKKALESIHRSVNILLHNGIYIREPLNIPMKSSIKGKMLLA